MRIFSELKKHFFLFQELTKRDFKKKYKRTVLGMGWSVLSPLLQLLVMSLVFGEIFGKDMPHFTIYLFCGVLIFNYFTESTKSGMRAILENAAILQKVNVPKYLFLASKNLSSLINFGLTMLVFLAFCVVDRIAFSWRFFALLYPVAFLLVFNLGMGMIFSALNVFFRDISYLYDIFVMLLRYLSAIFYTVDRFSPAVQRLFYINPLYCYIRYFRIVVLEGGLPSGLHHLLCAGYALAVFGIGALIYKQCNRKFVYYI
ncbi:MAG: ABC transporter permease [Oscillospiraceae bacterium]|nr:ABC transporter permease [Oscillospiraceae bacterium]